MRGVLELPEEKVQGCRRERESCWGGKYETEML